MYVRIRNDPCSTFLYASSSDKNFRYSSIKLSRNFCLTAVGMRALTDTNNFGLLRGGGAATLMMRPTSQLQLKYTMIQYERSTGTYRDQINCMCVCVYSTTQTHTTTHIYASAVYILLLPHC